MTAYCGGGTSSARPDFAATIYVAPAAAAALLNNIPTPWAVGFAALLGLITYDLTTFCTNDPPAIPSFDIGDYLALASPIPVPGRTAALVKLNDLIGAYMWPILCRCDSVPTPAQGPAPDPPEGLAPIPGPVGFPNDTACATYAHTKTSSWISGFNGYRIFPQPVVEINSVAYSEYSLREPIPAGCVSLKLTVSVAAGATGTPSFATSFATFASDDADVGAVSLAEFTTLPGVTETHVIGVPAGAIGWRVLCSKASAGSVAVDNDVTFEVEAFCGVPEGTTTLPCCPPDPQVTLMLTRILDLLTITQRQAAPFAYVYGDNHTGLSGDGSFAVSGLLGVSVDVTSLPTSYGQRAGTPVELFDLGWVTLGTEDGYDRSRRVDHDGCLLLPDLGGVYTVVGYSLAPGVTVSIRELVREP